MSDPSSTVIGPTAAGSCARRAAQAGRRRQPGGPRPTDRHRCTLAPGIGED
jgi:hypothetical protein